MKKIFILTGEASGDKLASKVIASLKKLNGSIEYLSVGGEYLESQGIKSLYNLREITYLGFTKVLFNIFKIKKKIIHTADKIISFNPDILFSVDSPDFTLRVAKRIKKTNPNIKTIHFVAPKVYVWRKHRVKKLKSFLDHILLLFPFEKKYFDEEKMTSTFVGHPLLDQKINSEVDKFNLNDNDEKIISIFPGSRLSEINVLMPILIKFIYLANKKYNNFIYVFHVTKEFKNLIAKFLSNTTLINYKVISDENTKQNIFNKTIFAIAKSGTISLEISNAQIPSLIIYKMNFINFFIVKLLVKIRFANIFNIVANSEVIPELLQSNCNHIKIFETFDLYIKNPNLRKNQITNCNNILNEMKTDISSTEKIANILNNSI